jgi:uncharacterized protein
MPALRTNFLLATPPPPAWGGESQKGRRIESMSNNRFTWFIASLIGACFCTGCPNTTTVNPVSIDTLLIIDTVHTRLVLDTTIYNLPHTHLMDVPARNGQTYRLLLHLPDRYSETGTDSFPVIFFTDGAWDFALMSSIYHNLKADGRIPEAVMVGITYPAPLSDLETRRTYDYSPLDDPAAHGLPTGGASDFLEVLAQDLIPAVRQGFRTSHHRFLAGSSLGGMFALYAMFNRPSLFQGYVAASPAVVWGNGFAPRLEAQFARSHDSLPVALYMTAAALEIPNFPAFRGTTLKMDTTLRTRNYTGFRYGFRLLDDADHSSSKAEAYTRGLQFLFATP